MARLSKAWRAWALAAALGTPGAAAFAQFHGMEPSAPESAEGQVAESRPALISIYPKWQIDESTRVGRRSRPMALSQNAWPTCYADAAAQALDMSVCRDEPGKKGVACSGMPDSGRVSSLWLSKVGSEIDGSAPSRLEVPDGGSAFGAIRFALGTGDAPSAQACPWPKGNQRGEDMAMQALQQSWLTQAIRAKKNQRKLADAGADPESYLAKYWKAQWTKSMAKGFPELSEQAAAAMELPDEAAALGAALWSPGCDKADLPLPKAAAASLPSSPDGAKNLETLQKLLASGREPIVSVCLDATVSKDWSHCVLRHAFVVIGLAHYSGEGGPKEGGWGLWALNSWGERWQEVSRDGWIRAESIMARQQGDFEWVEAQGRVPFPGATVFDSYAKERAQAHWKARQFQDEQAKIQAAGKAAPKGHPDGAKP